MRLWKCWKNPTGVRGRVRKAGSAWSTRSDPASSLQFLFPANEIGWCHKTLCPHFCWVYAPRLWEKSLKQRKFESLQPAFGDICSAEPLHLKGAIHHLNIWNSNLNCPAAVSASTCPDKTNENIHLLVLGNWVFLLLTALLICVALEWTQILLKWVEPWLS